MGKCQKDIPKMELRLSEISYLLTIKNPDPSKIIKISFLELLAEKVLILKKVGRQLEIIINETTSSNLTDLEKKLLIPLRNNKLDFQQYIARIGRLSLRVMSWSREFDIDRLIKKHLISNGYLIQTDINIFGFKIPFYTRHTILTINTLKKYKSLDTIEMQLKESIEEQYNRILDIDFDSFWQDLEADYNRASLNFKPAIAYFNE